MQNLLKRKNGKKKAFTLVEILIVVAVIGILFVSLVPRIDFAGDKARETGIKTDFRSFEIAAEQVIRENAGFENFDDEQEICDTDGINLYLDRELHFNGTSGECSKLDQWNQPYTIQVIKPTAGEGVNPNNGAVVFISNGKDSLKDESDDNYALVVTFVDGYIETSTLGFTKDITSDNVIFEADDSASMNIDADGVAIVKYAK